MRMMFTVELWVLLLGEELGAKEDVESVEDDEDV